MTGEEANSPGGGRQPRRSKLTTRYLIDNKFIRDVHQNTLSDVIIITDDQVRLCLLENDAALKDRDAWRGPAGILATLLTVMVTAAPQDKFGLSKEMWTATGLVATA